MKLSELKLNQANPRVIKDDKFRKLMNSIKDFPKMMELRPIVYDTDGTVLGGNMRLKALQELGMKDIPDNWAVRADQLNDEEKRRFIIADNSGFGEWDFEALTAEWDAGELDAWGIDIPEQWIEKPEAVEDDYQIPDEIQTDIVIGDLFEIGVHRLLCGDSTDKEQVERLMRGEKADMVLTDPPYGVSYASKNEFLNSIDKGNRNQSEIKNDHLSKETTQEIWKKSFENMGNSMNGGAVVYCFMPQGGDQMMMMMMMGAGIEPKHELIWLKNNHVLGRVDYAYKHEPILYAWKDSGHKFYGDFQTSILEFNRPLKSELHPTMKPIELLSKLISNSSQSGHLILDIFLGSGSTMVAAHQLNRRCYGLELEPKYVEIIVQRMLKLDNTLKIIKNNIDVTEIFMNKLK